MGTVNGLIGGDGKIDDWKSSIEQTNKDGYISNAYVSTISLDTPDAWVDGITNLTSYDGETTFSLSYKINSFYDVSLIDNDWGKWLMAQGCDFVPFSGVTRFSLPFDNYFLGINSNDVKYLELYDNSKWQTFKDGDTVNYDYSTSTYAFEYGNFQWFTWLHIVEDNNDYYGYLEWATDDNVRISGRIVLTNTTSIKGLLGSKTDIKKPQTDAQKGVPSVAVGGAGDLVKKAIGEIPTPSVPQLGLSTTGAYNVYKVGQNDLQNFMSEIFHVDPRGTEQDDWLKDVGNIMSRAISDYVNGDLTKFVIDCHILPITPTTESTKSNIHIGGHQCENSRGYLVTSDYVNIDFGTITISPQTVSFYDGASDLVGARYKLYLPFGIGYVDLEPSLVWCHTLQVIVRFNIVDGSCIAFVKSSVLDGGSTSVIGTYSGSCCVHLPFTGENYSRIISGIIGVASSVASGNVFGVAESSTSLTRNNITMSNNYNSSSSYMSIRYPYLLIEKPTENLSANFYERNGGLINSNFKLRDLKDSGFTKCGNVDIMSLGNIKTSEKTEIKRLLEQGVYL